VKKFYKIKRKDKKSSQKYLVEKENIFLLKKIMVGKENIFLLKIMGKIIIVEGFSHDRLINIVCNY